jgi:biotin-(acetyl-CoA carboxylase) ligase
MTQKTIAEMLAKAKELKLKEIALKAEMKLQKTAIATEYIDNMPEAEKQKQIAEADKILNSIKQKAMELKETFRNGMKALKADKLFAKEILDFVNYKQNHSLPKAKNQFRIEKNFLLFNREGISEIKIDISKANWQEVFKVELKKQGINGENRIADNIVYKAKLLLESNKMEIDIQNVEVKK